jgi:acyl transferase domain-containing protein
MTAPNRTAFLYASQGTQWPQMGRDLMAEDLTFRRVISRCDQSIRRHFDWSLCRELEAESDRYRLHAEPCMVQPALTALQIALTEILAEREVFPAAVGSLSMGEAAAGYCAGMLHLDEAIDVACSVAKLAETKLRAGLMAVFRATWRECTALIADVKDRAAVAVELGRRRTVISGEETAVRKVLSRATHLGIKCAPLPLAQAYHSPDVAGLAESFGERLTGLCSRQSRIASYSSATGTIQREITVEHCWRVCSAPAYFYTLALAMIRDGYQRFIEIGPDPMLTQTIREAAGDLGIDVEIHAVMQRGVNASLRLETTARKCRNPDRQESPVAS